MNKSIEELEELSRKRRAAETLNYEEARRCAHALRDEAPKLFTMEAPSNHYRPAPEPGWFAMRSGRRRIFMKLEKGSIPHPQELQRRLSHGEYIESGPTHAEPI